jgi:hypothetical protein
LETVAARQLFRSVGDATLSFISIILGTSGSDEVELTSDTKLTADQKRTRRYTCLVVKRLSNGCRMVGSVDLVAIWNDHHRPPFADRRINPIPLSREYKSKETDHP